MFRAAVSQVITDTGFQLPTEPSRNALTCAEKLLEWLDNNKTQAEVMASSLVALLEGCFHKSRSPSVARDRMWGNYYKLRSSEGYKAFWSKALSEVDAIVCPIFYQFVADKMMDRLIVSHFPVHDKNEVMHVEELDFEEQSALRYAAGSVIRSLMKKTKRSAHPLKDGILLCLAEMVEECGKLYLLLLMCTFYHCSYFVRI